MGLVAGGFNGYVFQGYGLGVLRVPFGSGHQNWLGVSSLAVLASTSRVCPLVSVSSIAVSGLHLVLFPSTSCISGLPSFVPLHRAF